MKSCFFVQSSRIGLFECVHAQFARADDDAALSMAADGDVFAVRDHAVKMDMGRSVFLRDVARKRNDFEIARVGVVLVRGDFRTVDTELDFRCRADARDGGGAESVSRANSASFAITSSPLSILTM